jgi:xanthine dehydrogenase YagR molybdenum-binding subunit
MTSIPIEMPDAEANITGAKGLGEPVTIPTAAAVANAVRHAVGIRVTESPISPMQLCSLLQQRKKED